MRVCRGGAGYVCADGKNIPGDCVISRDTSDDEQLDWTPPSTTGAERQTVGGQDSRRSFNCLCSSQQQPKLNRVLVMVVA